MRTTVAKQFPDYKLDFLVRFLSRKNEQANKTIPNSNNTTLRQKPKLNKPNYLTITTNKAR